MPASWMILIHLSDSDAMNGLSLPGRHVDHFSAILLETRLELRQRLGDRLLQARDDRRWGLGGSEQADQESISRLGTPASVMVGTSGICALRFEDRIAIPLAWPDLM